LFSFATSFQSPSCTARLPDGDIAGLRARLDAIAATGVPNYFGPQRFGRDVSNLRRVGHWLATGELPRERAARGFLLSAARSLAFNAVLGRRVADGSWNRLLPGEIANLDGNSSVFRIADVDRELEDRCRRGDIHPSGPLCGDGGMRPEGEAAAREEAALAALAPLPQRLAAVAASERRALVLRPVQLEWQVKGRELKLAFELRRGAFATSLLREALSATVPDAEMD